MFVSADMEGIAGIVDRDQVDPAGAGYALGRRWMTGEADAAVRGAFEGGADEVVVCDAHWNKRNLLLDELDPRARVVAGGPRPLGMMAGLDGSFAAAIFLGYHTAEGHPKGVLGHTWSHVSVDRVLLNGREASEGVLNAAIAGWFGVPVVLTAGDRWANEEIRAFVGEIETADVKEGLSPAAAETLSPGEARALVREKARAAVAARERYRPVAVEAPVRIEVRFKEVLQAHRAARLADVERVDGKTIRYVREDPVAAFETFAALF